jgi:tyrosinase
VVDVTPVIDKMHLDHRLDVNDIRVTLVPTRPLPQGTTITVGRISLYREAVQP